MEPLGHVGRRPAPALALRAGRGAMLAGALLTALATGEAVGQPGGVFRGAAPVAAVAGTDLSAVSDAITSPRRLVAIDFGQLTPPADTAAAAAPRRAPSGVLRLNLFDDASFTGFVESMALTFSGGYSRRARWLGSRWGDDLGRERRGRGGLGADAGGDLPHPARGSGAARRQPSRPVAPATARRAASRPGMGGTCAPGTWGDRLGTPEPGHTRYFQGRLCGRGTDLTIDVAVVHTPAARDAAGGVAAIEAEVDLMVAAANQTYAASGIHHRLALSERSEVSYTETGNGSLDLYHLWDPSDGHMDGVHEMRDRVGADLVHLVVGYSNVGGISYLADALSLGVLGLLHDRAAGHGGGLPDVPDLSGEGILRRMSV